MFAPEKKPGFWVMFRTYLFSGLLVLGPTTVTIFVLVRFFTWMDGILGEHLRFPWFEYRRIPGLGFLAVLLLLLLAGWTAHRFAGVSLLLWWDRVLNRIPFFRLVYSSAKQLGEALLSEKRTVFRQVVLVNWPHPEIWALGFVTAPPPTVLSERAGGELMSVFVPSTPNPTTGFYQLVPAERVVPVELTVEQGIQMIVSGGVIRPRDDEVGAGRQEMELPVEPPPGDTSPSKP